MTMSNATSRTQQPRANARRVLRQLRRWYLRFSLKYQAHTGLKVSFAQLGEDLIIRGIFNELGIQRPTYMDVGAFHPYNLSNTALLYFMGSRGINIEPNPELISIFHAERPDDTNLNIGIADQPGELTYYMMSMPTLNTFSKESAEQFTKEGARITDKATIPVLTLQNVVDTYCVGRFPDFLSLDIEGLETTILQGLDYQQELPKVLCIETLSYSTSRQSVKNQAVIDLLTARGYFVYADTHLNTIFVRSDIYHAA